MALPVHTARSVGLGCDGDVGPRRCRLAGTAAEADASCQSKRILLRLRSTRWHAASCQAVHQDVDLGKRHWQRRAADQDRWAGTVAEWNEGLPIARWRHQLVLAFLQSDYAPLLHSDLREMQRVYEARSRRLGKREDISRRNAAHGFRSDAATNPTGPRHPDGIGRLGTSAAWARLFV